MRYWHQLPRVFDSIRTVTFLQPTERFKQMNCTLIMIINELKVTPSAKSLAFIIVKVHIAGKYLTLKYPFY